MSLKLPLLAVVLLSACNPQTDLTVNRMNKLGISPAPTSTMVEPKPDRVVYMPEVRISAKPRTVQPKPQPKPVQPKPQTCHLQALEQGGSPSAPFVLVCEPQE